MTGYLRIGEISRRSGVAPDLLRAWERRYGLVRPTRSPGGFRLYSDDDLERVRAMQSHLAQGLAASEAASRAVSGAPADTREPGEARLRQLTAALDAFDDTAANAVLDGLFAELSLEMVLAKFVLRYLDELGQRWERGEASVAQEHFASSLLRGRLLGFTRGWDRGVGPRTLLACAPGELHDLSLLCFGLALRTRGWRVTYLGADTPLDTLKRTAAALSPRLVVLSATTADGDLEGSEQDLRELAATAPLALAGPAVSPALAERLGVRLLAGSPLDEAERVATGP
ncbi:MAG TPA: MerR family transcriptional regulator [Gaiellaceae bacterium]